MKYYYSVKVKNIRHKNIFYVGNRRIPLDEVSDIRYCFLPDKEKYGKKMAVMLKKAVAVLKKGELERVKQARASLRDSE